MFFLLSAYFFKINICLIKFFHEYHRRVKKFGSRSGSKLFAKVFSRQHWQIRVNELGTKM